MSGITVGCYYYFGRHGVEVMTTPKEIDGEIKLWARVMGTNSVTLVSPDQLRAIAPNPPKPRPSILRGCEKKTTWQRIRSWRNRGMKHLMIVDLLNKEGVKAPTASGRWTEKVCRSFYSRCNLLYAEN
jgi:hypothetical protein